MRFHRLLAVLAAAVFALVGLCSGASAAQSSHVHHTPYAAQAKSLGLTADQADRLQTDVQREVQNTGGTQVAVNEVRYDGGATVFPLPGDKVARPLAAGGSAVQGTLNRCPRYYFCTYSEQHYQGTMHMLYHCRYYTAYPFVSYMNNQTAGTRARFYDEDGDFFEYSQPAVRSEPSYASGLYITSILPCPKS